MKLMLRKLFIVAVAAIACASGGCSTDGTGTNGPPEIRVDVQTTFEYVVGEGRITITVTGEDPDGHDVVIGLANKPERARIQNFDGWAVFDWDPLASDVTPPGEPLNLVFFAEDQLGARSERVVSIVIIAGNGVPRFENSPSVLYNTDSGKPLVFEVRVRDDDTPRVALAMPTEKAPVGASFIPLTDKAAKFEWMPSEDQLEFRVHSVTFTANDGVNDPVEQKVSILFKKSGGGDDEEVRPDVPEDPTDPGMSSNCGFESAVLHTPLGAQRGTDDYVISATLSAEAAARYDRLTLSWTDQDAFNSAPELQGSEMAEVNGSFSANIPNPVLGAGETKVFYYQICAIDDDSTDDDSVLCGPTSVYYSFTAYSPSETECVDDQGAGANFDAALDMDTVTGWHHGGVCAGTDDYYRMDLLADQDGDVFFIYPMGQGVTVEMFDENQAPLTVEPSACAGYTYVFVENDSGAPITRYFKVSGTDSPYHVSPFYFEVTTMCAATDMEPNDTALSASIIPTDGTATALQETCGITDVDVFKFAANTGEEITATALFSHDEGDLDIKLFAPSQSMMVGPTSSGVASGLSFTDNEELQHVAQETGDYYLLVRTYTDPNTYTLAVTKTEECTDDDSFGDNHSEATSANATAFTPHRGLEVCPAQDDWYEFMGFQGEFIEIDVKVTSGSAAAVSLTIHRDGSQEATGSITGMDMDTLSATVDVLTDGIYKAQVTTTAPVEYELLINPVFL